MLFTGENDKALADCNEAIGLDRKYSSPYVGRGLVWDRKGKYRKAIAAYTKAVRYNPQSADGYHNRGNTWVRKGKYDRAIADLTEAIRLDPQDSRGYVSRGIARKRSGKYREAITDYTDALRLDPKNPERYITFAWLLATCRDGQHRDGAEAVRLSVKACKLTDYSDAHCLICLAAAHAEQGTFADAVAWQLKALELADPEEKADLQWRLKLYEAGKPYHEK
jgi:tetratricopeptide (TPR) repeat protein